MGKPDSASDGRGAVNEESRRATAGPQGHTKMRREYTEYSLFPSSQREWVLALVLGAGFYLLLVAVLLLVGGAL